MKSMRIVAGLLAVGGLAASASVAGAHEIVLEVSRSAGGQLKINADLHHPVVLPVSIYPGIAGYADAEPAFHSTILDDPAGDSYQLSTAVDLRWILVAKDPGVEVWNDTGSGFLGVGGAYYIGVSPFDTHPMWNIPGGPAGATYSVTLLVRDLNGVYADSAPIVVPFQAVPEPGVTGVVAGVVLLGARRSPRTRCVRAIGGRG